MLSVEVRDWSRPVGSGWVEEMSGKHQALRTDKLVLVSKSGFTKPAIEKAKARGIETLTIEEACDTDWDLALTLEGKGIFELFNVRFDCSAHIAGKSDWYPVCFSDIVLDPSGKYVQVGDIISLILSNPTIKQATLDHFYKTKNQEYHAEYQVPTGTIIEDTNNVKRNLVKLSIGLHLDSEATPIEFAAGRFRGRDIVYGQAPSPDNSLCIVMRRGENGKTEGVLYNGHEFRRLVLDAVQSGRSV